jgi:hypothetical protein
MLASTVQFSRCGRSRSPVRRRRSSEHPVRRTSGPPVPKRRTENRRRFEAGREGVTTTSRGSVPSGPNSVPASRPAGRSRSTLRLEKY